MSTLNQPVKSDKKEEKTECKRRCETVKVSIGKPLNIVANAPTANDLIKIIWSIGILAIVIIVLFKYL